MATERRAPEDLQEAVAATLRRLRGEIGAPGQVPAARQEPVLGPTLTGPGAPFVATPSAASPPPVQPDLLSRAETEHEIPPNPSVRLAELRQTLARPDPADRQRTRLLPYMLSILAVAVFAGIGWWAYKSVNGTSRNGEVPVVAASQVPEKVPPAADQGADTSTTSGNKTIYNEVAPGSAPEPKTEVLLPPPEAPQVPPSMDTTTSGSTTESGPTAPSTTAADTGSASGSSATTSTTGSTSSGTSSDQTASSTAATTANNTTTAAASSSSSAAEPATTALATNSATTTAASSGMTETLIPSASTPSGAAATAEPASVGATTPPPPTSIQTETTSQSAAPAAETAPLPAAPLTVESTPPATTTTSTDNANGAAASAAAAAPATTAAAAPASSTPASPTTTQTASLGNYRIQLASLKSEAAAQKTWKRLATKYKDVLASLTVHIQRVALTSGTYYRLQAGPFEDKTSANAACTKLRAHGQQCIVKP
ncbi:MAG TPA: SPOR domain-containing protein [Candidatus Udaeobacter sp.]|nr:SPOR domain-containing protein [Candidatus Udaeobacter sp.]